MAADMSVGEVVCVWELSELPEIRESPGFQRLQGG